MLYKDINVITEEESLHVYWIGSTTGLYNGRLSTTKVYHTQNSITRGLHLVSNPGMTPKMNHLTPPERREMGLDTGALRRPVGRAPDKAVCYTRNKTGDIQQHA